jgi:hypothetical protein
MPEPGQLVVERQLPTVEVIPEVKSYHYVKVSDSFTTTKRPANQLDHCTFLWWRRSRCARCT